MRKIFFATIFFTSILTFTVAQDYSRKPGKISDYELKMTTYAEDTSAAAVILYKNITGEYKVAVSNNYIYSNQRRTYYTKYKVLKQEGVEIANVEISYYYTDEIDISSISASSYNLVNGKNVETKLSKKYIFDEQVSANYRRIKFSVPNVQVGSVVEIKYNVKYGNPVDVNPLIFQYKYPLVYGYASIAIPQYYHFITHPQGHEYIEVNKKITAGTIHVASGIGTYTQEVTECTVENIPALKNEDYVWCFYDHRAAVNFELLGFNWPGKKYEPRSSNWEAVNKILSTTESDMTRFYSHFLSNLKIENPFKTEVRDIISSTNSELERITQIHKLVMSKIVWDERYRLGTHLIDNVQAIIKKGSGCSAEVNFILNAALADAGFKTTPILLNPRWNGRLPKGRASLDNINAFIIRVTLSNGSFVYLDGTSRYSAPNVLPAAFRVDKARIYGVNSDKDGWVNLTGLTSNTMQSRIIAQLETDGRLSGKIENTYTNIKAMNKKRDKYSALNEKEYIENSEEKNDIKISDYLFSDTSKNVNEKYNFSMQANVAGDFIYLNASVFPFMKENILSKQERELPVEFSYPKTEIINCMIAIPDGYKVEELPKATRLSTCKDGVSFQYSANVNDGIITVSLIYKMNRIIYSIGEYGDLRTFFGMVSSLSLSNIILKKE
jgi:hypothetical protein